MAASTTAASKKGVVTTKTLVNVRYEGDTVAKGETISLTREIYADLVRKGAVEATEEGEE